MAKGNKRPQYLAIREVVNAIDEGRAPGGQRVFAGRAAEKLAESIEKLIRVMIDQRLEDEADTPVEMPHINDTLYGETTDPYEMHIVADTLETEEMTVLVTTLETEFKLREGYKIDAQASCNKGPQGQWWTVKIYQFETIESARMALNILRPLTRLETNIPSLE